ncbi:MAG: outer membrane protein [Acidimicrobiales bacterium]|nr:outer membrane protein [Acidimicrobiales bacterium]
MSPTSRRGRRLPGLDIKGPVAHVPEVGGAGDLPYAPSKTRWGLMSVGVALLALIVLGSLFALVVSRADEGQAAAPATTPGGPVAPTASSAPPTTARATTSTSPTTTTTTTTTTTAPTVPVAQLPRHEAVYRDGKLVLQGTVPTAAIREQFRKQAAAVIGAANVIVRYRIDPRVPTPTDGRVRVDEDFLFPKNSAAIDPRYRSLMELGVTVMKLNPQARMRIVGYTDDSGPLAYNVTLSTERAQALRGYLISQGIEGARVEAVGRGPADPVATNDTEANRGRNRRIEVELLGLLAR